MAEEIPEELIMSIPDQFKPDLEWAKANNVRICWQSYRDIAPAINALRSHPFPIRTMLEIGVLWGMSAILFSQFVKPGGAFVGVDNLSGCPVDDEEERLQAIQRIEKSFEYIRTQRGIQAELIVADSISYLERIETKFDAIHVDGNHTLEGFFYDVILSYCHLSPNGIMIIDDVPMIPQGQQVPGSSLGWHILQPYVSPYRYRNERYGIIRRNDDNDTYFAKLALGVIHRQR